jgi:hypothetical protein
VHLNLLISQAIFPVMNNIFSLRLRFPKAPPALPVATTALLGSLSILSAGGSHALGIPPVPATQGGFTVNSLTAPTGSVYQPRQDLTATGPYGQVATIFDTPPDSLANLASLGTEYTITSSLGRFLLVNIDSTVGGSQTGVTVTKEIYNPNTSDLVGTIVSTNGSTQSIDVTSLNLTTLRIRDTVTGIGTNAILNSYQNSFTAAPGPLPVLGAGAAFATSRKLRSRIKASRLA